MNPILRRESAFKLNRDIWNTKLGAGEIDIYKPTRGTLAGWIGEVERRMGKLRFHPHWGSACGGSGSSDWNAKTEPRKVA